MTAAQFELIAVLSDDPRRDDERSGLSICLERDRQPSCFLHHHLARRRRPDEQSNDAEQERHNDRLRRQRGDEVTAPDFDALLALGNTQFARDDDEIECPQGEQGQEHEEPEDERLPIRCLGQRGEIADLEPRRVEPGQPQHGPGNQCDGGEPWQRAAEHDSPPGRCGYLAPAAATPRPGRTAHRSRVKQRGDACSRRRWP